MRSGVHLSTAEASRSRWFYRLRVPDSEIRSISQSLAESLHSFEEHQLFRHALAPLTFALTSLPMRDNIRTSAV